MKGGRLLILAAAFIGCLHALQPKGSSGTPADNGTLSVSSDIESAKDSQPLRLLRDRLEEIESRLSGGNAWTKVYSNYRTYRRLKREQEELVARLFKLKQKKHPTLEEQKELERYEIQRQTNLGKLQLLSEYRQDPFRKLIEPPKIEQPPHIGNPFGIIGAYSYLKKLQSDQHGYEENYRKLMETLDALKSERSLLGKILARTPEDRRLRKRLEAVRSEIDALRPVAEIYRTTLDVTSKKIDEIRLSVREQIKREARKAAVIGSILLLLFVLFLLFKRLVRKYLSDKESFYTINKVANFLFVTVVILILLFAYIENVNYLVTIVGFASAGIAIAMKDWFMSLLGWFAIVLGGTIHVGDRVKFVRDGVEYVGDIVDISLLRMTMHEDITLTTYMNNRRSGRVIFIPNNYVFTDMIANYSHAGLKTVWDGIDFTVTFDSDPSAAASIAKEVAKKYSKGYTDITRKQLNKLRSQYHLKNTNVEPRVFTFIENYGIRVSVWYLTNAFATLTLRSTISTEILQRIRSEETVELAYPTQSLYLDRTIPRPEGKPPEAQQGEVDA